MDNSTRDRRSPLGLFPGQPAPRLYDRVVEVLRTRHYSHPTEEAYLCWIRRFLLFHNRTHPRELAEGDLNCFLTHLVRLGHASACHVLQRPLDRLNGVVRARKPKRLPAVLTPEEVESVLDQLDGVPRLVATLLHGSGRRVLEALELRVKDLHFGRGEIRVRDGKDQQDRVTLVPHVLHQPLQDHLRALRGHHEADLALGLGRAPLPDALVRKYPNADRERVWQWVFPASSHYLDRRTGVEHRHHLHESVVQKAIREGALRAHLSKRFTSHTFRHSIATRVLEAGCDIRTVQDLLGHSDVRTTMIYTHVLNRPGHGVHSPLDRLCKPASGEQGRTQRAEQTA